MRTDGPVLELARCLTSKRRIPISLAVKLLNMKSVWNGCDDYMSMVRVMTYLDSDRTGRAVFKCLRKMIPLDENYLSFMSIFYVLEDLYFRRISGNECLGSVGRLMLPLISARQNGLIIPEDTMMVLGIARSIIYMELSDSAIYCISMLISDLDLSDGSRILAGSPRVDAMFTGLFRREMGDAPSLERILAI